MVLSSIFLTTKNQKGGSSGMQDLLVKHSGFLAKIFTNLLVQLSITYYVMENYPTIEGNRLLIFLGSLVLVIVIAATNLPYWVKFFVFALFSYLLGRLSATYKKKYSEAVIRNGILGAMGVFLIMFVIGALMPILGDKFGTGLFFALLALLIARIVASIQDAYQVQKWLSGAGIGIFGLYVAYDTNNILKRADYYQGDFITASMDYYLDVINLVQNIMHVDSS